MNRNVSTMAVGVVLLGIFLVLLVCFQVRQNEVAFLTTFGKASPTKYPPGIHLKWPWPIEKVHKFDARAQNFESRFQEALTQDGKPLLVMIYLGWRVTDPQQFNSSFGGDVEEARRNLESLAGSVKSAVVGKHPFSHFISTDEKELKFSEIETEMLTLIKAQAQAKYGVGVEFLGIKRLGLPESITTKVFERMKAERQRLADKYTAEGAGRAIEIEAAATSKRSELLAGAESEATKIKGQAEAKAADSLKVLEQSPELAIFLQKLTSLESILKERSTLILDPRTPPFDLLRGTNQLPTTPGK
jgi:membrane protease subunit HflC